MAADYGLPTAEEVFNADAKLKVMERVRRDPPLPLSPCLKSKANGVVFLWSEDLAAQSHLCVNCDENGNEDPAVWQGRGPAAMPTPEMTYGFPELPPGPKASPPSPKVKRGRPVKTTFPVDVDLGDLTSALYQAAG